MTRARSLSRLANSTVFTVSDTNRVGIGSTIPDVKLDVGGKAIIDDTTQTTSVSTGALVISGGVGIGKSLFVGGDMSVAGTLTYEDVTNTETAGITTTGGLVVTGLGATFTGVSTFFSNIEFGVAGAGGTITPLGHAEFVGVVTASSFSGDGSGLTGVASTDNINTSTLAQFTGQVGIADSIFHIGDTDTSIRFPGADTFSVETGGTKRFEVDSSGNVVLGFAGNSLYWQNGFNDSNARIQNGGASNNSNLKFFTRSSGTEAERLRITSGGSVGFNTTLTQSSKTVHIAGDYRSVTQNVADEGLIFQSFTTASTGDVYPGISWSGNPTALGRARASINAIAVNDNNGSDLVFLTRNQADGTELDVTDDERLRITSGGLIGVNVTPTQQKLTIDVDSSGTTAASFDGINICNTNSTTNNGAAIVFGQAIAGNSYARIGVINSDRTGSSEDQDIFFGTLGGGSYAERLRIASLGQIGLGGANYGTAGQVITSNGSGSAPTWQDASGGISTQAGTASGIITSMFLNDATDHKVTATGICTITTTQSGTEGQSHTIRIVNSGIATVGFSTYFLFPSGSAPVLPTADGAVSLISFTVHDSVGAGCTQLLAGASVNFS